MVSLLLFNVIAKIPTNGVNPLLFQMSGIIIWNYFAACFTSTSNTFVANAGIFGKVYFPRLVSPLSTIVSQLIQFGIQFLLLITVMVVLWLRAGGEPVTSNPQLVTASWLLIPLLLLLMAGMGLGFGVIVSSITTKYRDLTVLIGFGIQLLMYISAVNYPLSALQSIGDKYGWLYQLVKWNPLAAMVEAFRNALLGGAIPWTGIAYSAAWMVGLLTIGTYMFSRVERTFMDTV